MEKQYTPDIYKVVVTSTMLVTASNPDHAQERVKELLKSRITQYVHPDDDPPQFKVIAVIQGKYFVGHPTRLRIVDSHS